MKIGLGCLALVVVLLLLSDLARSLAQNNLEKESKPPFKLLIIHGTENAKENKKEEMKLAKKNVYGETASNEPIAVTPEIEDNPTTQRVELKLKLDQAHMDRMNEIEQNEILSNVPNKREEIKRLIKTKGEKSTQTDQSVPTTPKPENEEHSVMKDLLKGLFYGLVRFVGTILAKSEEEPPKLSIRMSRHHKLTTPTTSESPSATKAPSTTATNTKMEADAHQQVAMPTANNEKIAATEKQPPSSHGSQSSGIVRAKLPEGVHKSRVVDEPDQPPVARRFFFVYPPPSQRHHGLGKGHPKKIATSKKPQLTQRKVHVNNHNIRHPGFHKKPVRPLPPPLFLGNPFDDLFDDSPFFPPIRQGFPFFPPMIQGPSFFTPVGPITQPARTIHPQSNDQWVKQTPPSNPFPDWMLGINPMESAFDLLDRMPDKERGNRAKNFAKLALPWENMEESSDPGTAKVMIRFQTMTDMNDDNDDTPHGKQVTIVKVKKPQQQERVWRMVKNL